MAELKSIEIMRSRVRKQISALFAQCTMNKDSISFARHEARPGCLWNRDKDEKRVDKEYQEVFSHGTCCGIITARLVRGTRLFSGRGWKNAPKGLYRRFAIIGLRKSAIIESLEYRRKLGNSELNRFCFTCLFDVFNFLI